MARLEIFNSTRERQVVVTLSRRNLLALLHKLDMSGSAREIDTRHTYEDGVLTPERRSANGDGARPILLVVRAEDDDEHYAGRPAPGQMHPRTEEFIQRRSGAPRCRTRADVRCRFTWRVLRHRPRLWRFWRITHEVRKRDDPRERVRILFIGDRRGGVAPQLVVALARRTASLESIYTFEASWYAAAREPRHADRALAHLMPSVRIGRYLLSARLVAWPGQSYALVLECSRGRGEL